MTVKEFFDLLKQNGARDNLKIVFELGDDQWWKQSTLEVIVIDRPEPMPACYVNFKPK